MKKAVVSVTAVDTPSVDMVERLQDFTKRFRKLSKRELTRSEQLLEDLAFGKSKSGHMSPEEIVYQGMMDLVQEQQEDAQNAFRGRVEDIIVGIGKG